MPVLGRRGSGAGPGGRRRLRCVRGPAHRHLDPRSADPRHDGRGPGTAAQRRGRLVATLVMRPSHPRPDGLEGAYAVLLDQSGVARVGGAARGMAVFMRASGYAGGVDFNTERPPPGNVLHEPVRWCGVTLAYEPLFEVPITNASDDTSASRSNSGAQLGGAGNVQTPSTQ